MESAKDEQENCPVPFMTALIRYDAAITALAEARAVDEVKDWHDKAAAMQAYGRMAKDKSLEVDAAEIRLRAERRLGELITAQKESDGLNQGAQVAGNKPGAGQGSPAVVSDDRRPTLASQGISKDLSSRAQKLAAVPAEEFEQEVGEWRERVSAENARVTTRLTKAGERAIAGKPDRTAELEAEIVTLREQVSELSAQAAETLADNESMAKVFEADDKVAAALAEAKKYREMNRLLEERIRGLQGEKNEAVRMVKSYKAKLDKLEKVAA